jgi:hypothetical protein
MIFSLVKGIFAVIGFREFCWFPLFAPYLLAGPLGTLFEVRVAFLEVSIDGSFGFVHRFVIAIVNDGAGHAAKYGFDHKVAFSRSIRWIEAVCGPSFE